MDILHTANLLYAQGKEKKYQYYFMKIKHCNMQAFANGKLCIIILSS